MSAFQAKTLGKNIVVAATSLSLLSGCLKRENQPAATAPEAPTPATATLPSRQMVAEPSLVSFFQDKAVPADVKKALLNEGAVQALQGVLNSGNGTEAITYHRNAYPPEIGQDAVKIIQHLLNGARMPAQQKIGGMLKQATAQQEKVENEVQQREASLKKLSASPKRDELSQELTGAKYKLSDLKEEAAFLSKWVKSVPPEVAIDGDYGRACHGLRAYITQSEHWADGTFPHNRQDSGSSDTGIGPRTLGLLLRYSPAVKAALTGPYEVVSLSFQAAGSPGEG